jgi:hypothetical protein
MFHLLRDLSVTSLLVLLLLLKISIIPYVFIRKALVKININLTKFVKNVIRILN